MRYMYNVHVFIDLRKRHRAVNLYDTSRSDISARAFELYFTSEKYDTGRADGESLPLHIFSRLNL